MEVAIIMVLEIICLSLHRRQKMPIKSVAQLNSFDNKDEDSDDCNDDDKDNNTMIVMMMMIMAQ